MTTVTTAQAHESPSSALQASPITRRTRTKRPILEVLKVLRIVAEPWPGYYLSESTLLQYVRFATKKAWTVEALKAVLKYLTLMGCVETAQSLGPRPKQATLTLYRAKPSLVTPRT
jgi:hypothetical protein